MEGSRFTFGVWESGLPVRFIAGGASAGFWSDVASGYGREIMWWGSLI